MSVERVLVATDQSETARRAVEWAADLARCTHAQLILARVLEPDDPPGRDGNGAPTSSADATGLLLAEARRLGGARATARVVAGRDPAEAIVRLAHEEEADVLVVGNVGMQGRREFLLANVPNRVSHSARCTVVIVNSCGDAVDGAGAPVTVPERTPSADPAPDDPRLMGRAAQIAAVFARRGLEELLRGSRGHDGAAMNETAEQLRGALEELGPTFCKLGQVLSTRPDLVPPPVIRELSALQDHVPPMSEEEVVSVMELELGVPWEDVFETIEPQPLASGTIAQVHRATLTDGERVVVKVQRPTARGDITRDLALLEMFARRTARRPGLRRVIDLEAVVTHLSDSLQRELDFRSEAANLERLTTTLAPYPRLGAPRLHATYTTPRLLVMEEIQGCAVGAAPSCAARREAARQLLESYYRQILTDGFFHADPHPGNLKWCDERIYFLDFGMVGEIDPEMRQRLMLMLLAFWQEDVDFLTDVVLMIAGSEHDQDVDVAQLRREMGELVARHRRLSLRDIDLGVILQEMAQISVRHGVPLPAALTLTGKAMAQMQLAVADLDPDLDPFAVVASFLGRNLVERLRTGANLERIFYESQKFGVRLVRMVESLERATGARPGPKLQVQFRGIEGLEAKVHVAGRRLAVALVAAGAFVAAGVSGTSERVPRGVTGSFGATGGVLTAGLVADLFRNR